MRTRAREDARADTRGARGSRTAVTARDSGACRNADAGTYPGDHSRSDPESETGGGGSAHADAHGIADADARANTSPAKKSAT